MAARPQLFTRDLSGLGQSQETNSPAEQRDDAKRNFLKTMRPLPTQHYWNVYFDRQSKDHKPTEGEYTAQLEQLGTQIESVQDFWRYNNNTPVEQIKMRESIYLFKQGFRPVWEDRRNINGGSWTFRVPRAVGPDVWTRVQLLAIGEQLEAALDEKDQLCGVGLSVRFKFHLITVWHRDASKQKSIDGLLECVMKDLPTELQPRADNYFYKKHADHEGFKVPPELQGLVDAQKRSSSGEASPTAAADMPQVSVQPPQ
ncbi:hypothetical protein NQ176_g5455 [Zarea fungicola]|uniref:Uncharacterized protein n=1 Tax=Zarea fungicola TaxID=93591 RepID=A0ACC1N8D5_9HYPO|nr:hypothetical protein NQ176_g5455 [Lecanicillium fungicola]